MFFSFFFLLIFDCGHHLFLPLAFVCLASLSFFVIWAKAAPTVFVVHEGYEAGLTEIGHPAPCCNKRPFRPISPGTHPIHFRQQPATGRIIKEDASKAIPQRWVSEMKQIARPVESSSQVPSSLPCRRGGELSQRHITEHFLFSRPSISPSRQKRPVENAPNGAGDGGEKQGTTPDGAGIVEDKRGCGGLGKELTSPSQGCGLPLGMPYLRGFQSFCAVCLCPLCIR